jgi:hypothetical protein
MTSCIPLEICNYSLTHSLTFSLSLALPLSHTHSLTHTHSHAIYTCVLRIHAEGRLFVNSLYSPYFGAMQVFGSAGSGKEDPGPLRELGPRSTHLLCHRFFFCPFFCCLMHACKRCLYLRITCSAARITSDIRAYMYIYMYTHTHTKHTHTHIHTHTCIYVHVYLHIYISIYLYMYVFTHTHTHTHKLSH